MATVTIILSLAIVTVITVQGTETIIDVENPSIHPNSIRNNDNEETTSKVDILCHVEYQVMKRVRGHCIKLGTSSRGCVAGNYLQPFHPECM